MCAFSSPSSTTVLSTSLRSSFVLVPGALAHAPFTSRPGGSSVWRWRSVAPEVSARGSVAAASFMRGARSARELISKLASSNMRARVTFPNPASRVLPTASSRWRQARAWAGSGDASRRARDSPRPARGLSGSAAGSWREDAARWADGLDAGDADAELARLSAEIARHDELYYNDAEPEVSDAEYDLLRVRLEAIERAHPALVREDSPTRRVGAPVPSLDRARTAFAALPPVRHAVPVQSLQNAFNAEEVHAFVARARARSAANTPPLRGRLRGRPRRFRSRNPPSARARTAVRRAENRRRLRLRSIRGRRPRSLRLTRRRRDRRGRHATARGCDRRPSAIVVRRGVRSEDFGSSRGRCTSPTRISTPSTTRGTPRGLRRFKNARNAAAGALRRLEPPVGDGTDAGPLRFAVYSWGEVDETTALAWSSQSAGRRVAAWGSPPLAHVGDWRHPRGGDASARAGAVGDARARRSDIASTASCTR